MLDIKYVGILFQIYHKLQRNEVTMPTAQFVLLALSSLVASTILIAWPVQALIRFFHSLRASWVRGWEHI